MVYYEGDFIGCSKAHRIDKESRVTFMPYTITITDDKTELFKISVPDFDILAGANEILSALDSVEKKPVARKPRSDKGRSRTTAEAGK